MTREKASRAASALVGLLVVLVMPFVLPSYLTFEVTMVFVWAIGVLGVNVLVGYSGQLSVASNAFMAIGAYTSAILTADYHWPYYATIPVGAILGFLAGFVVGVPALRVKGFYLATVTLALAVIIAPAIKRWDSLTHGPLGVMVTRPGAPKWLEITSTQWRYFATLSVLVLCLWLVRNLLNGNVGRAWLALKDNELVAETNGINLFKYKTLAFALGSSLSAVAGCAYTYNVGLVTPDSFSMFLSINLIAAGVLGGITSIWGAVAGAILLQFVPSYANEIHPALSGILFGVVLLVVMLVAPTGLAGLCKSAYTKIKANRH